MLLFPDLSNKKNGGMPRKGHVNAIQLLVKTDGSGKVSPLERTKLGRRFVQIKKYHRCRAERLE
jgi:hypothetical protein